MTTLRSRSRSAGPSDVYHAIADPTRRRLVERLRAGERSVSELAAPFAVSRPAISQHLRVLREAGLVSERRVGRERRYRLHPGPLREVSEWVRQYEGFWTERLDALERELNTPETFTSTGDER